MARSPVLPEGIAVDELLQLAGKKRGGERHPGSYHVVQVDGAPARACKGLVGAVRRALAILHAYTDHDDPPFCLLVGDDYVRSPYFEDILDAHPDARFVLGWSAEPPLQDMAVAVLALPSPGERGDAKPRRSKSSLFDAIDSFHESPDEPKAALAQIRALVKAGVDPHETRPEGNALHALFDPGYDPSETDLTVLDAIARALLQCGVDEAAVNEDGYTPGDLALGWDYPKIHARLHHFTAHGAATAATYGRLDALRHLASLGVPLDEPDPSRRDYTPLHHAIEQGHADVAAFLLERGADPTRETLGWKQPKRPPASARELAAKSKHPAIRALFTRRGR